MLKRFALTASVLALVLVSAGCASGGAKPAASTAAVSSETFPLSVVIDNNLSGIRAVTVQIARASTSKLLGSVESSRKKTFSYNAQSGAYTLIARTTGAGDDPIVSQVIQVAGPMSITWHLSSNTVVEGQ